MTYIMSCVWLDYMIKYFQCKNCVGSSPKTKKCVASFLVPGYKSQNPNIIINGDTFGFLIFMSFYNLEITVVCSIFSASSKPCITSAMMRVAKINPELNASHSVMQDSSLVQSLNFSKVSFCFIVRLEFRSPSFLHINLT